MPRVTTASLNYQLTNFAVGHMNDMADVMELAERLAPTTPVPGSTGQYKIFDDLNSMQTYNTARALGGDPTRIAFEATDGTYACRPQGLEITIDTEERRQVGEDNALGQQLLDQGKIKALVNITALSHVKKVADFVLANSTPVAARGNWSNEDIDPIDQLDEQLDELTKAVGSVQNIKLDMDVSAWRALRNHPKVKARATGVQVGGISREQLNSLLMLPVDFKVSSIVYNTAALGQTKSKARVLESVALLHYSVPNATQYDPSAFKTFTVGPENQIAAVRSYMSTNGLYDGHIIDWSEQIAATSSIAIKRLNIT